MNNRKQKIRGVCVFTVRNINYLAFMKETVILDNTVFKIYSKKVKVTLAQALRLCTGHTTHRGSRGIALPFHDHGTRRG